MSRIINPPKNRIRQNTNDLNNYFATLRSNLRGKENEFLNKLEILQLLNRVPDTNAFTMNYTTYDEVQKIILNLRNDCSSGHDNIPVEFLKLVVDQITSPIIHIMSTSIDKEIFHIVGRSHDTKNGQSSNYKGLSTNIYFTCFTQSL